MKKYLNIVFAIIGIAILVSFGVVTNGDIPKVAYVDLATIYDGFPMKKELEAKMTNVQQARKNILDSLKIDLNALTLSIKSEKDVDLIRKFQIKKQEYLLKEQTFQEDNQATTQTYSEQIWKQLNQYVKDYGKENKFTYILGTDGSGNIMYADESKDITKEVSNYVNEKYSGEKK